MVQDRTSLRRPTKTTALVVLAVALGLMAIAAAVALI
jgi:hypothetical protein